MATLSKRGGAELSKGNAVKFKFHFVLISDF